MVQERGGKGAMARAGAWASTMLLVFGAAVSACKDTTNPVPVPAAVKADVADTLAGVVAAPLDSALKVLVVDANGNPIAGTSVTFSSSAGGSFSPGVAVTDDQGVAQATYTFGTVAGAIVVTASDTTATPATFYLTAMPAAPSAMTSVSGDAQSGAAGSQLSLPMVVLVADQYGNPVSGVTVTWTTSGAGTLSTTSSQTDASGHAQTTLTLDGTAGSQTVTASATGLTNVVFTATGT
ncbi:MAG: Ig-like domain-containing protein [Gemmatimonadales bacterium]